MKPIKLKNEKRSNVWKPERKVWYEHNDDERFMKVKQKFAEEGFERYEGNIDRQLSDITKSKRFDRIKKEID